MTLIRGGREKVTYRVMSQPEVTAFVQAANEFCAFVEGAHALNLEARLTTARSQLLALYAAATRLPEADAKMSERVAPHTPQPERWPGFDAHDHYWEVFDPYDLTEPVGGSLSDDVLDVYSDVRRGLWFWERGDEVDAIWEWRFLLEAHWGDHAVDALRALHRACKR
jgi:hypothetical protein